jgi:hypothetical protein
MLPFGKCIAYLPQAKIIDSQARIVACSLLLQAGG